MKHRSTSFLSFSRKKLFGFLAIFALSGIALQGNVGLIQETHAQTNGSVQTASTITDAGAQVNSLDTIDMIDIVLKMIYVLLWPLLVLAGWSLDNTLVYGSFFHLDAPLWKFWNMIKNFANFTLGFLVLVAILRSIFSNSGAGSTDKENTPLNIIKKTLIAGVLIQASWFLTSALIDVSTVTTYAVGGLPLSVIKNTDMGQQKILSVNAKLDLNKFSNITQKGKNFEVTYGAGKINLSSCIMSNNGDTTASAKYVIGRISTDATEPGYCVLFGNTVIPFNETGLKQDFLALPKTEEEYSMFLNNTFGSISTTIMDDRNTKGNIVDITSSSFAPAKVAGKSRLDTTDATTLSDIITKSKGFVGPLVTMYSSLLNFSQISDTSISSLGSVSGEVIIKAGIAVALLIPLLALTVVLIIRIGFLWLVIAVSPLLILSEVFKIKGIKDALDKIGLSLSNIVSVIFAPVITVFALSISLVFLSTLIKSFTPSTPNTSVNSALSPDISYVETSAPDSPKYVVNGLFGLQFQNFSRGGSLDWFSWLIVNLVAIGLLRAILFAAIKANSLGKKFAEPIQKFGENMMGTLPIVPLPGGEKVGVMSGANVLGNAPDRWLSTVNASQEDKARKLFETPEASNVASAPTSDQYTKIASSLAEGNGLNLDEHVNAGRKEGTTIDQSTFLNNSDYMKGLIDVISKTEQKVSSYSALGDLWGKEFMKRVETLDAKAIATELNANEATRAYASTLMKTGLKTKKGSFGISQDPKDADKYTVTPPAVNSAPKE